MSERRFLVDPAELQGGAGSLARVAGDEHHHLSRVLRLRAADPVWLFDGAGRGFSGAIEQVGREETLVKLEAPDSRAVEPSLQLTLAFGVPHHEKMDLVVQKCTELGVSRVVPILAQRSVLRPRDPAGWKRLERWRRVARDAARQSGRLRVPEVAEPVAWESFLAAPEAGAGARWLLSTEPGLPPLPALSRGTSAAALVAVGPEGGFTAEEIEAGRAAGLAPVGLGARILRAETAAIVAVALSLFLAGDLADPRDRIPDS